MCSTAHRCALRRLSRSRSTTPTQCSSSGRGARDPLARLLSREVACVSEPRRLSPPTIVQMVEPVLPQHLQQRVPRRPSGRPGGDHRRVHQIGQQIDHLAAYDTEAGAHLFRAARVKPPANTESRSNNRRCPVPIRLGPPVEYRLHGAVSAHGRRSDPLSRPNGSVRRAARSARVQRPDTRCRRARWPAEVRRAGCTHRRRGPDSCQ